MIVGGGGSEGGGAVAIGSASLSDERDEDSCELDERTPGGDNAKHARALQVFCSRRIVVASRTKDLGICLD